jgi:SAM-dependent methyltransferase
MSLPKAARPAQCCWLTEFIGCCIVGALTMILQAIFAEIHDNLTPITLNASVTEMEWTLRLRARHIARSIAPYSSQSSKVLDIGCGNGVVTLELRNFFGFDILGTDVARYLKKDIPFIQMKSATRLDFEDKQFDVGLINDVLHHIEYDQQLELIQEAARVCKTVLIFEAKPSRLTFFCDKMLNRIHNKEMPIPLTFRHQEEWEKAITANGLACTGKELKKPFVLYPFQNFLLRVANK